MSVFSGEFTSDALHKNVVVRIIFPDSPFDLEQLDTKPKTMYLLHGYGGSSGDWLRFTRIEYLARLYNFTIVMADADNSFYSNMKYGGDYLKFFTEELPTEVNKRFKIPQDTFICGQSMGGYGCLKVGLTRPDLYKAIGAFSAAAKVAATANNTASNIFTDTMAVWGADHEIPKTDDCFYLAEQNIKNGTAIPICLYCGTDDFIYPADVEFQAHLEKIGYPHTWHPGNGRHMWDYWDENMPLMMEELCKML